MPYDFKLADRIREYLSTIPSIKIEEKEMFRGLTFRIKAAHQFVAAYAYTHFSIDHERKDAEHFLFLDLN